MQEVQRKAVVRNLATKKGNSMPKKSYTLLTHSILNQACEAKYL